MGATAWRLAAASLILCFLVLAFLGVREQDPTYDEPGYLGVGKALIERQAWNERGALLHPPLSFYVNSLPLFLLDEAVPQERKLLSSRLTSLVVFGVPLLVTVLLWARDLYGREAALVALALAAFSPTLLAHAPLITPDLALTATGFLASYLFWRSGGAARGALAWGAALGLCLLTKANALLFAPVIVALGMIATLRDRDRRRLRNLPAGLAVAWLVLVFGYGFRGLLNAERKVGLIARLSRLPLEQDVVSLLAPLLPLPYLRVLTTQLSEGMLRWPTFLMGEISETGWWYYFAVAFLIKETLPFLILLAAAAVLLRKAGASWFDELQLLLAPLVFFAFFSFVGKLQIGIRYMLPGFPFLFVFASKTARLGEARPLLRAALGGLLLWHAGAALRVCPEYIAYFNELVGGPANGYRYLGDSNLDWGQNRSRVKAYTRQHNIEREPPELPDQGKIAVRVDRLQGRSDRRTYRLLRDEYDPVGHVGYNWLVYDLGRNRRFPKDSILEISSGPEWLTSSASGSGPAQAADAGDEFVPARDYPGTAALLMQCAAPGPECRFRRSFALRGRPLQATLYFTTRERYELHVNGRLAASRSACPTAFVAEERRLERLLHAGDNSIAIRTVACADGQRGFFAEMRVAQAPR
jgi:4-amino-4-deoxy-L-arabinose transferase-like glycosyltransferase